MKYETVYMESIETIIIWKWPFPYFEVMIDGKVKKTPKALTNL